MCTADHVYLIPLPSIYACTHWSFGSIQCGYSDYNNNQQGILHAIYHIYI